MQGDEQFEVITFLGCRGEKKFFKVQCKKSLELFTMEVVVIDSNTGQFGPIAEALPNWGLPFCVELRYVFEDEHKRYYILGLSAEINLADVVNDGLPEPTVLFIAAELVLALESLHELGVSYGELALRSMFVDNNGHIRLWREFEGKEYWHISECICGVLGANCGKTKHEIERQGMNMSPWHWDEISRAVEEDWRKLGAALCQLLTGPLDFQRQSLEETIISLFITPNTKDFLYGLVTGTLQSFDAIQCHPCFDGLDWNEVKSKTLQSPLIANYRCRLSANRFAKSPSLQNVYAAGMIARQERGLSVKSPLGRTHSTGELRSSSLSNSRPNLSLFDRRRRSTLNVPSQTGGQSGAQTESPNTQIGFRRCSKSVGAKSSLSLKRQLFKVDQRSSLSAPCTPRDSLTSYGYPATPVSAPSSPQGSTNGISWGNSPQLQATGADVVCNRSESNLFHEEYQKKLSGTMLDAVHGMHSLQLEPNDNTLFSSNNEFQNDKQLINNPFIYGINSSKSNSRSPSSGELLIPATSDENITTYGICSSRHIENNVTDAHARLANDYHVQRSQHRRSGINLDTTDGMQSLQLQTAPSQVPWANATLQSGGISNPPGYEQVIERKQSVNFDQSTRSSIFQPDNQTVSTSQSRTRETADMLFQKYFQRRRASVGSGIISSRTECNINTIAESTQIPQTFNAFEDPSSIRHCNLATSLQNTIGVARNSRSPEPVVAIHPVSNVQPSQLNPDNISKQFFDKSEFLQYQKQSQRRRSSSDIAQESTISETSKQKPVLPRSASYSNVNDGFRKDSEGSPGMQAKRSMALRRIPSYEEFRSMRALKKMAYGAGGAKQEDKNDYQKNREGMADDRARRTDSIVDNMDDGSYSNINSNDNNNGSKNNGKNNNHRRNNNKCENRSSSNDQSNNNVARSTNNSSAKSLFIQDLLVKYGLNKSPRSSTMKAYQNLSATTDTNSSKTSAVENNVEDISLYPPDTKQRLLNILDDFLAVRTKDKILSASTAISNRESPDSCRARRRCSLPSTLVEKQVNKPDCSNAVNKTLDLNNNKSIVSDDSSDVQVVGGLPSDGFKEYSAPTKKRSETSSNVRKSSSNSKDKLKREQYEDTSSKQSKVRNNSKQVEQKSNSEIPRPKSKRSGPTKRSVSDFQGSQNNSLRKQAPKVSKEEFKVFANQSDESMISSELKAKEPEGTRRVSEKARNMARKHRESLELVKKSGRRARKERRKPFTPAAYESKENQDEYTSKVPSDLTPAVKVSGPIRGDHSVEALSPKHEQASIKYSDSMHRRTSSLLSLTDDVGGDFEDFESFPNNSDSVSELNDEKMNVVSRGEGFLAIRSDNMDFCRGNRTESSSSLLSRGSSFHSNYSGDSGSVQLDFSEDDDELFYLNKGNHEKPETDIQRNDSGLGDEIGVGTRAKKRWGRVTSSHLLVPKEGEFEECQEEAKVAEVQNKKHGQKARKISREKRISEERQPNTIDCPDCGRAFIVEKDRPSVKSEGPTSTMICYKCQSHRVERKEAIIELVQTEANYGNDFQIIKEEFLSPMQTGGIISSENLAKIFLNIQELLDVSTKFSKKIEDSIEECVDKNDEELCRMNVGKIFVENVELFQAYELYCSKQPEAINLLETLQKKNDVLRVFLNITCRENPKCRKMDINSFLFAPVQRVTKYPLLLDRIRRATPRWHGDREDLKVAQRKVEEQIAKINSLTKCSEVKTKKFQSSLGSSDAVDGTRLKKLASDVLAWTLDELQLLMHGQLKVQCFEFGGGQSWTKRSIKRSVETHLLFCIRGQNEPIRVDSEDDDSLLYPKTSDILDASILLLKRKSNGKYTLFRDELKLRDCVVYDETESDSFGLIHMGKECFQFTASTSKDARKWLKYLKLQAKNQGKWRRRRNASANIMLKTS